MTTPPPPPPGPGEPGGVPGDGRPARPDVPYPQVPPRAALPPVPYGAQQLPGTPYAQAGGAQSPGTPAPQILGIVSIVFGIVGIPASCCCWFIGWIFPVAALVAAVVGLTQARGAEDSRHRPLLIAGAVLGGTGLLLVAAAFVAGLLGTIPGLYDVPGDY